ncbi:flagellar hook capping FlgD N-terminal domain-containing protein [Hydrogenoanaerobacterium sp.]|uniref:flagellar hook capping FlgD N-terminal domain-containing protein n=1 Tax=Hydrogenoanaerobacterium sp. TaxID=2953763 RepID=UPI0028986E0F|nr:flagellar hook capping FlgD N-terminal domain-containing protein [Hydrogenoanaerobacterium sp.]
MGYDSISGVGNNSYRTNQTSGGQTIDAVYGDAKDKQISVDNFLQLMIAQLKNQDFTNPVDDTQYVTQLAQFATMQQMQELAYHSKSNFMMSLVGKDVTVAKLSIGGNVNKVIGPVERISFVGNEFKIYVAGKEYSVDQLMEVHGTSSDGSDKPQVDPSKYTILPKNKTDTTIDLAWPVPTSDEVIASKLKYTVYYSTGSAFDTVDEVKAGIRFGSSERGGLTSETITGLEPDTTYFINVVVKDGNGKETVYQKTTVTTKPQGE